MTDGRFEAAVVAKALEAAGMAHESGGADTLARFLTLLARWNRVYNLTGIRSADDLIERHLIESLAVRSLLKGPRIADVGSGAGLPGIPLAITAAELRFSLIESRAKRARFLRHVVGELDLGNVSVEQRRVEDLRCEVAFDTVLARAVAPPADLLRLVRHLTAPGSRVVILTGHKEAQAAEQADADFVRRSVSDSLSRHVRGSVVVLERSPG